MTPLFRLLGPLSVVSAGSALPLGGPQQRRLLGLLAVHAGRPVSIDRIVGAVWPDGPPAAYLAALQAYISRLRALLAPADGRPPAQVIVGHADAYCLAVGEDCVDALRFQALGNSGLSALRDGRPDEAVRHLRAAAGIWQGPLLGELEVFGALLDARRRLDGARQGFTDGLFEAELAVGNAAAVLPELTQRVVDDPLHEPAHLHLMTALRACGRQADALAAYARARQTFRRELGVEPGEQLRALHRDLLGQAAIQATESRLPAPVNRLHGRDDDLAVVHLLLERNRLVTIAGPAGAGKTRLAVEVGRDVEGDLPDGVHLTELATAAGPAGVAHAVARTLGVLEQPEVDLAQSVARALSGRSLLLVLDNCEHVVAQVAELATTLLEQVPGLRILATSQEALRVDGEHVFRLAPLNVPDADAGPAEIAGTPAGRLFLERARAARHDFTVDDSNAQLVAQVCRELDGLPLALELAAATLGSVDIGQVAARLPDRFAVLARGARSAPPRHRSLQAAVDWSYELLTPSERSVFDRLSVFAGGFTIDAVHAVCEGATPGGEVDQVLAALVDKSLVQLSRDRPRYTMLETLRIHGAGRLKASGADTSTRQRHALSVLRLCEQAAPELRGPGQLEWITRLDDERDNVAAALRWSLEQGEADVALGIVSNLWWYWWRNGHIPEGARWAEQSLAAFPEASPLRAAVLVGASHLWWKLGRFDTAEPACRQALEQVAGGEPTVLAPAARGVLAMVARDRGDLAAARLTLSGVLEEYVRLKDSWGEAATLNMLVSVDRDSHDLDLAVDRLRRSADLFAELGDLWGQAWSCWLTGRVSTRRGELQAAAASLQHSIVLASQLRHGFGVALGLAGMAGVAAAGEDFVRAARLLGATDALEQAMGVPVRAIEREDSVRDVTATRHALGSEAYREHWRAGAGLHPDAAVAEALAGYRPPG